MSDVKWIKITTDIFDDEKILLIESMPESDSVIVIWFKLLCMAGRQNNSGVFMMNDTIAYTDEMLATIFRRPLNTVRMALAAFQQYGMIEVVDGAITIPNWEKHQSVDKLERMKQQNRERVARHREKQKALAGACNVTVTLSNAPDIDKDIDIDKENIRGAKRKRFTPPSLEEVRDYCQQRNNSVDPQRFIDHYESNGWKVGRNKMKDWKAAVRTWERSGYDKPAAPAYKPNDETEWDF